MISKLLDVQSSSPYTLFAKTYYKLTSRDANKYWVDWSSSSGGRCWTQDAKLTLQGSLSYTDLDLNQSGYVCPTRWNRLWEDYTFQEGFRFFLISILKLKKTEHVSYTFPMKSPHSNGNCMLAMTVNTSGIPTVRLYSRSCFFGRMGMLDFSIALCVARYLHYTRQIAQEDIRVVWHLGQLQISSWSGLSSLRYFGIEQLKHEEGRHGLLSWLIDRAKSDMASGNYSHKFAFHDKWIRSYERVAELAPYYGTMPPSRLPPGLQPHYPE